MLADAPTFIDRPVVLTVVALTCLGIAVGRVAGLLAWVMWMA